MAQCCSFVAYCCAFERGWCQCQAARGSAASKANHFPREKVAALTEHRSNLVHEIHHRQQILYRPLPCKRPGYRTIYLWLLYEIICIYIIVYVCVCVYVYVYVNVYATIILWCLWKDTATSQILQYDDCSDWLFFQRTENIIGRCKWCRTLFCTLLGDMWTSQYGWRWLKMVEDLGHLGHWRLPLQHLSQAPPLGSLSRAGRASCHFKDGMSGFQRCARACRVST